MDRSSLELLLGQGLSVEEIGRRFGKHPTTVSYWMDKLGLEAVNRKKHAARGGIDREPLEALVEAGMTIAELSAEFGVSKTTLRHWLLQHGLRTKNARGRRSAGESRAAKEAGPLTIRQGCVTHGETDFILEGRGYYRCMQCRAEGVARHRRKLKAILVEEAGGCCCICGYDRHPRALQFHHLDPDTKRRALSAHGITVSLDALRAEASKCVLICSNCHAEVEAGLITLPVKFQEGFQTPIHRNLG